MGPSQASSSYSHSELQNKSNSFPAWYSPITVQLCFLEIKLTPRFTPAAQNKWTYVIFLLVNMGINEAYGAYYTVKNVMTVYDKNW